MAKSPATKRVREQIDQSLDFIPSALCNGLHDTGLEPTDRTPDLLPFNGVPVGRSAREPHQQAFLPPTYLLVSLSRLAKVLS